MGFLVLGLGNPGREYERTRHNAGFWVVDRLADAHRFDPWREKFGALYSRGILRGTEVILGKPQTFMNRSGEPGGALARFYKVDPEQVIVVHDELDFEPGLVRVKVGGGAGGHNGLRSLTQAFGSAFIRVRVGVGKPPSAAEGASFVLNAPRREEQALLDEAVVRAAEAVEAIVTLGAAKAMSLVNGRK